MRVRTPSDECSGVDAKRGWHLVGRRNGDGGISATLSHALTRRVDELSRRIEYIRCDSLGHERHNLPAPPGCSDEHATAAPERPLDRGALPWKEAALVVTAPAIAPGTLVACSDGAG